MSKFSLDVLQKYVHPHIDSNDPDVILGAVFGEDVALTRIKNGILVSHIDPIVGAVKNIGWLAVHVACNDIATSGAPPRWILILVLLPEKYHESNLDEIMSDAARAAKETGVTIIGGHTGFSSSLSRPLVAVTAFGTLSNQTPICTKGARIGDHVILTKGIALEGTAILAYDFADTATKLGLSQQDIDEARHLLKEVSIIPEALLLAENGATAMHDVTRGGLMETLLEIARLSEAGIQINSSDLLISDVVTRFSKMFKFDPLKMISSGSLVATLPPGRVEAAGNNLKTAGIPFADIGVIIEGEGVTIMQGNQAVHHNEIHCEEDELARMWQLYPLDQKS